MLCMTAGYGLLMFAGLFWLASSFDFPVLFYFDPRPEIVHAWVWPLLAVSMLVAVGAFLLLRQWQSKQFRHDLVAAIVLPALLASIVTASLLYAAAQHAETYQRSVPDLSSVTVAKIETSYAAGMITPDKYQQSCRWLRQWKFVEEQEIIACAALDDPARPLPDIISPAEFAARLATARARLERSAMILRIAGITPWLFLLLGLGVALPGGSASRRAASGT